MRTAAASCVKRSTAWAPAKRILHDDGLDLDDLIRWIGDRRAAGGPVALHCVTAAQLVVTLEALRCAGRHPRDRIEHAAVVPDGSLGDLAASGTTVVTQPNFVVERGDQYLAEVPAAEHHELWRVASLRRAGVPVALSTDSPFGAADPWAAMRAAVHRRTASGAVLGEAETVSAPEALAMFLEIQAGPRRPGWSRRVPRATCACCRRRRPKRWVSWTRDGRRDRHRRGSRVREILSRWRSQAAVGANAVVNTAH